MIDRRTWLGQGLAWPLAAALGGCATPGRPAGPVERERLHDLFARYWEGTGRRHPEWATYRGDHRFGDRLTDVSFEAVAAADAQNRAWLAEARAVDAQALGDTDRVSREVFIHLLDGQRRMAAFEGWRSLRVGPLGGPQVDLANLLRTVPVDSDDEREQLLTRLAALPRRLEQEAAWLERGVQLGWVSPRPVLERVLRQFDDQLALPVREGPYFEPWRRLPSQLDAARRGAWQARGEAAVAQHVVPAMRALREVIAQRCLPKAPAAGGLSAYPGGEAVYAERVREMTTTSLSPRDIHDRGLAQLQALQAQMGQVQRQLGVAGGLKALFAHLDAPTYRFADGEALLQAYRAVAKRLDAEMPRLFAELPRTSYGIRPMAPHLGAGAADNYQSPSLDGSRPGWYNANVLAFERRPRWALATLVAHETVPGHHLQSARAIELGSLPAFRRDAGYAAFGEGWALYAERLMDEIGFYESPEERFGYLRAQAMRAARLVVDTGLHAFGWSRERAIAFMTDEVGESEVFIAAEVDRYLSMPAQALAYMVGQLHILDLRERSRAALGARFDLRRFNNAVIDQGALPLDVLTQEIERWQAAQARG